MKLSVSFILTAVVALFLGRYLPESTLFKRLVLSRSTNRAEGYAAASTETSLVGLTGKALSSLRPSGAGQFGDRKLDVVTRGNFVDSGAGIRIVEVNGSRLVVETVTPTEEAKS